MLVGQNATSEQCIENVTVWNNHLSANERRNESVGRERNTKFGIRGDKRNNMLVVWNAIHCQQIRIMEMFDSIECRWIIRKISGIFYSTLPLAFISKGIQIKIKSKPFLYTEPLKSYSQQTFHMHASPHIQNSCTCTPCLQQKLGSDPAKSCIFGMEDNRDVTFLQYYWLDSLPCDSP